ncbi:hypothetical protein G6F68_018664 [Rhizopus microsporus]|nr:hypothetical protein G6F68_018664 [Rhizopus microsporus]
MDVVKGEGASPRIMVFDRPRRMTGVSFCFNPSSCSLGDIGRGGSGSEGGGVGGGTGQEVVEFSSEGERAWLLILLRLRSSGSSWVVVLGSVLRRV